MSNKKNGLSGAKGGGGSFRNRPDNLRSTDTFEALIGLGTGRIRGLAPGGLKNLYVDDVPVADGDGNPTLTDFVATLFNGDPALLQPIVLSLGGSSGATSVGLNVNNPNDDEPGEWRVASVTEPGVDYIDLRFIVSQLYRQDKKGIYDNTATLEVELQPSGSSTWVNPLLDTTAPNYSENGMPTGAIGMYFYALEHNWSGSDEWNEPEPGLIKITGKTTQPFVKELRVAVPNTGTWANKTWQVRVRLIEQDSFTDDTDEERRTIQWESIAGVSMDPIGDTEDWRGVAYLKLTGKASDQLTGIPEVTGVYDWTECRVPPEEVWNAETREYTGATWDGVTEQIAWTQCPAWQMKDLVEDDLAGISALAPGSTMNKWDVLEASKWFGEQVPDGKGGTHCRYSMNYLLTSAMSVNDLMQYVGGAVGAFPYDEGDGNWRLIVDKPGNAAALFTKEGIVGEFVYSHTDIDTRYNDLTGVFRNEDNLYAEDRVRVFDQDHIDDFGRRHQSIALLGCTNRQEALRRLKLRQLVSLNETKMVSFVTNRQAQMLTPSNIILVADGDLNPDEIRSTGRLTSIAGTTITVRDTVRLEIGVTYKIHLTIPNPDYDPLTTTQPDNEDWNTPTITIERTITNSSGQRGDVTTLYINTALPASVDPNAQVAFEAVGLPAMPKQYRVLDIDKQGDDAFKISAIEIYTEKWDLSDAVDEGEILGQVPDKSIPAPDLPVDGADVITLTIVPGEGTPHRTLTVNWQRPATTWLQGFEVKYSVNGGNPITGVINTQDTTFEMLDPAPGVYKFEVFSLDRRGGKSMPLVAEYEVEELEGVGDLFRGDWEEDTDYFVGQYVRYNGDIYVVRLNHTSEEDGFPPNEYMELFSSNANRIVVVSNRQVITLNSDGDVDPDPQNIEFTALYTPAGDGSGITWTLTDGDGSDQSGYLSSTTADVVYFSDDDWTDASNGTGSIIATVSLTEFGVTYTSSVRVNEVKTNPAEPAIFWLLTANRGTISTDVASNPSPPTQTTVFTVEENNISQTYTWTVKDGSGSTQSPTSTYGTVAGNTLTMTVAQFLDAAGTTEMVIVTATGDTDGLSRSVNLSQVKSGNNAAGMYIWGTRNIIVLNYDGTLNSAQDIQLTAMKQNLASTVTWSVYDGNEVARTPTITYLSSATGDVVDMTDDQFLLALNGTNAVIIKATSTLGSDTFEAYFTIAAQRALTPPERMTVSQNRDFVTFEYTGTTPDPGTQTTVFTAALADSASTVVWYVYDINGVARTPTSTYGTTSGTQGVTFTMTASQFNAARNGTNGVLVRSILGSNMVDSTTSLMMQKAPPPPAYWSLTPSRSTIRTDGAGALDPSTQTTTFTVLQTNTALTYTWTIFDGAGSARTPLATYATQSGTGNILLTMTGAQFLAATNNTGMVRVRATASDATYLEAVLTESGDGASAIDIVLNVDRDRITYDAWGQLYPTTQTTVFTGVRKNIPTGTMVFTVFDGNGTAKTPTATYGTTVGDTFTMTAAQALAAGGNTRNVFVYATIGSISTPKNLTIDAVNIGGDNLWPDPAMNTGATFYSTSVASPFFLQTDGATSNYQFKNYMQIFQVGVSSDTLLMVADKIPVRYAGEWFYYGYSGGRVSGSTNYAAGVYLKFRDSSGTQVGSTVILSNNTTMTATSDWPQYNGQTQAPADAATVEIGWISDWISGTSNMNYLLAMPYLSRIPPDANNTDKVQSRMITPDLHQIIDVSSDGQTVKSYQGTLQATRFWGPTDVTTSTAWTTANAYLCSASIGAATGVITLSSVTGPGYFDIVSTYNNLVITQRIFLEWNRDLLERDANGNVSNASASASGVTITTTTITPPTVLVDQYIAETKANATLNFYGAGFARATSGQGEVQIYPQYRVAGSGSAWTTTSPVLIMAAQVLYDATNPKIGKFGGATSSITSGITANTKYEVRWVALKAGTATSMVVFNTVFWVRGT